MEKLKKMDESGNRPSAGKIDELMENLVKTGCARCHLLLRYESSTLILYKELSSPIFQSRQSVSEASVTPVQISTLCNI